VVNKSISVVRSGEIARSGWMRLGGQLEGYFAAKGAAAKVLANHVSYRLGLTATPIYNYGIEMWNVMQFIDDTVLGSLAQWERS